MGGGASKEGNNSDTQSSKGKEASGSGGNSAAQDSGSQSQKGSQSNGGSLRAGETKGRDGASQQDGGVGMDRQRTEEQAQRLVCTVEEARSNSFVPFVSSVKEASPELSNSISGDRASEEEDTDSSSMSDESTKFLFGEVAIDLSKVTQQTTASGSGVAAVKAKSPSPAANDARSISESGIVFAAHHAGDNHDPWKSVAVGKLPPEGNGMRMGDLRVAADPTKMSVASWFSASTRYAVPRRYSFIPFAAQHGPIRCLSASAEANQVAVVVSGGKQCYVIDLQGNLLMSVKGHLDPVLSCSQSKDGKFLVTTSADCTAVMWDLNNGKKLRELPVSTQVNCVTVSDESDAIATTSTDDVVHLWDSKSCDPLIMFQRHTAGIFSMSFSRRGGMVASGSSNGEIYVWAQQSGEVRNFLAKHRTPVLGVSFSHDSQRLVSVDRESLRVWDLFTGQCIFCRDTKGNLLYGVDEEHGATNEKNEDNVAVRYTCCAFVAGQLIATGLTSKMLLLLDPNEGKEVLSLSTKNLVTSLSPSWMGDVLFVGDLSGNIYRLELTFSQSDVQAFHLDSKPPTKEKRMEKD